MDQRIGPLLRQESASGEVPAKDRSPRSVSDSAAFRAIAGSGAWTMFAIFMVTQTSPRMFPILLVGTIGVYAVSAWRLFSSRQPKDIESGASHESRRQLHR